MSSLIRRYVSGLAQILTTGEIADPTTEPAARREQHDVCAAGDQLGDLGVVVDVREAPAGRAFRHDVEQVEPGPGMRWPGVTTPWIGPLPDFE